MLTEITKKEQPQLKHLLNLINIFSTAHLELKNAVIPSLPLEVAVVKSAQLKQGIETDTSSWFSFGNKKSEKKDNPNPPKEPAKAVNETSSASKEQKEVEAHESSEVKKAVYTAPELNLDSVTTAYSKIIDKVPTFSIKMALKQSRPDFVDQKKVILAFNSESMRSKVETASGRNEVAKAFEEVFLRPLMIETKIDDITLRPVSEEGQDVGSDEKLSGKDLEDAVKEIFGTSNGS
jgi:DNA polymerase III gamma/tau subunit